MAYLTRLTLCTAAALCASAFADTATFQGLGPGTYAAMSRNGQYVLTYRSNGDVYRWSAATGQVSLGLNVGTSGYASAISDDGAIVGGTHRNSSNVSTGFRWTAGGGFTDIGDLPGGSTFSNAYAMSGDGNVIVGDSASTNSGTRSEAFRWTAATGIQPLGDLAGGNYTSDALSVSADGQTIVGYSNQTLGYEAVRWSSGGGPVGLGDIPGGFFNSQAYAVSSDGRVIAGYSSDSLNREQAFRWTATDGLVPLGFGSSDPNEWSQAHAVSLDGNVIVGNNNTGATLADVKALIWDPAHGMRHLQTALATDYGLTLASGWRLNGGWNLSDDGRIIAGDGTDPSNQSEAWVISVIPEPTCGVLVGAVLLRLIVRRRNLRTTAPSC